MSDLKEDIAVYEAMRAELETKHLGKWVLIHNKQLVSIFDSFDAAAVDAVKQFGRGPYLLRQVGAAPVTLPASVMYRMVHA